HFNEVGTRNGEERHIGLAGHRTGQKRLTGTRRADEQHTARNTTAEALELAGIAKEFDDFLEILLGFVHAGNVLERHLALGFGQELGARLAKSHRATAAATLHLPDEEEPHADN